MKTRKQFVAVVTLAVFMLMLASPSARAQDESSATLEETVKWLRSSLGSDIGSFSNEDVTIHNTLDLVSPCTFSLTYEYEFSALGSGSRSVYRFSLKDIDPLGIKTEHNNLTLYTSLREKKVTIHTYDAKSGNVIKDHGEWKTDNVITSLKDAESAKRVAKAFEHVIKLCGGKVDPF
jgi:hypothetical protein